MKFTLMTASAALLALGACTTPTESTTTSPDHLALYEEAVMIDTRTEEDLERDAARDPLSALIFAGIEPGDTVVEMEAGGGYFTPLLAHVVGPEGTVYMQNPAEFAAFWEADIHPRIDNGTLPGTVIYLESDFYDMSSIEDGSVDFVTWMQGPHELWFMPDNRPQGFGDPEETFAEIARILGDGGKLIVLDHAAPEGAPASTGGDTHRIDPDIITSLAEGAGLTLADTSDLFANPEDDGTRNVFDPTIRGSTDQFLFTFVK